MYYILFFCLLSICFNSCTQKQQTDPVVQVVNESLIIRGNISTPIKISIKGIVDN